MRLRAALLVFSVAAASCGPRASDSPRPPGAARPRLGGEVVAVVGATPITRAEVVARAARRRVDARTALGELEGEALMAEEARRLGLRPADAEHRRRQALAQLVLRAMERDHGEDSVSEAEVQSRIEHARATLTHPERRQASHLLVRPSGGDARAHAAAAALAAEALRLASAGTGDDATRLEGAADALRTAHPGVDVVVESLPIVERGASYDPAFLDALFGMDQVGLVPRVVTTTFGAHVVLVTRVERAVTPSPDEVREAALAEALNHERRNAVGALIREARTRTPPRIDEPVVSRRLGDDRLFGSVR